MPRRKWALPWFQSDSSEWTKRTIRIVPRPPLDRHRRSHELPVAGEARRLPLRLPCGEELAVGGEVALEHALGGELDRPLARSGGERGAMVGVLDEARQGRGER